MVDSYIHLSFYWILQSWDGKHLHYANWLRKFSKKPKSGCDDSLTEMTNLQNWNKNNPIIASKCHNMSICPHDTKLVLPSCPTIPDIILNVRQCCCFTILRCKWLIWKMIFVLKALLKTCFSAYFQSVPLKIIKIQDISLIPKAKFLLLLKLDNRQLAVLTMVNNKIQINIFLLFSIAPIFTFQPRNNDKIIWLTRKVLQQIVSNWFYIL